MSGTFQTDIDFEERSSSPPHSPPRSPSRSCSLPPASTSASATASVPVAIPRDDSQLSTLYQKASSGGEKLPASVNLVALRESFLSEAPFISNSNRTFWRRMVDNRNFQILLSASYYIIADCVSDTSVVNVEKLHDIDVGHTPLIKTMATNISEMYYTIKLRERELLFAKLPEVLAFMALTALRTSMPKHHRLCLSAKFREILIDWYCEVVGGMRFTNCRTNREWLFTDVFDAQIVTTAQLKGQGSNNGTMGFRGDNSVGNTLGGKTTHGGTIHSNNINNSSNPIGAPATLSATTTEHDTISVSKQIIGLSPLVSKYTSDNSLADLQVKMSLSHLSSRTITSLDTRTSTSSSPQSLRRLRTAASAKRSSGRRSGPGLDTPTSPLLRPGRPRMKKVDYDDVKRVLKTASNNRRRIMSTLNKNRREDNHELAKSRHELKNHISNLKKTQSAEMHKAKTLWQTSSTFSTGTLPLATATAPTTAGSTSTAL
jgi:hypothetical protein